MNRRGVRILLVLGLLSMSLFLLFCLCAGGQFILELPFTLAFGWLSYLARVIPKLRPDPGSIVTAMVSLVGVIVGSHLFLCWLHEAMRGPLTNGASDSQLRRWPWKRTLQLVGAVVLMFVSGIAVVGMVHQTGWLVRSPEPLLKGGVRIAAARANSMNNLKQIVIGAHAYDDVYTHFPQSSFEPTGRAMHSWQTAILPFIELANLYNEIDQKKPWTDPANAEAMRSKVSISMNPAVVSAPNNGYAESHYSGNVHIVVSDTPKTFTDFPQGASNTILAGEVSSNFRAWGDPLERARPSTRG